MGQEFLRVTVIVFLLSFSGLALEVALTRVFAVVLRYHFAFFAVALALCGLGFGGYLAHWLRRRWSFEVLLSSFVLGFPMAIVLNLWVLIQWLLPHDPTWVVAAGVLTLFPFLCLGGAIALLFDRYSPLSGKLYGADLLGAASASIGVIALLNAFGALNAVLLIAGSASLAASLTLTSRGRGLLLPITLIFFLFAVLNRTGRFWDLPPLRRVDPEVVKPMLAELATGKARIVFTVWNAFARTDVVMDEGEPDLMHLYTDGEVPALMVRLRGGDLREGLWLMGTLMGVPFALLTFPKGEGEKVRPLNFVLSLGSGGGADVVCALIAKAKRVDAVDVNPAMRVIAQKFRDFNGGIYERAGVHFYIAEGRSFVRRVKRRYDLIMLSLTQTATMGKAGLALVESFIHTKEACRDYWRALSRRGIVALITQEPLLALRWWLTCLEVVKGETEKPYAEAAFHLAWWELPKEMWGGTPQRQLVVLRRHPFTDRDVFLLREITRRWKIIPVAVPFVHLFEPMASVYRGDFDVRDIVSDTYDRYKAWVAPVTDDAPFFADLSPTIPPLLLRLMGFAVFVIILFGVMAWGLEWRKGLPFLQGWLPTLYAGSLGIGFMLVEIGLLQRTMLLLGSPTHTVAFFVGGMLLGGATGSWLSQRISEENLPLWASGICAGVATLVVLVGALIGVFVQVVQGLGFWGSALSLVLFAYGIGLPMGIPFPLGLRLAPLAWTVSVPYLWGVNGVASVFGSVGAVSCGKLFGYSKAVLLGGICYLIAALLMRHFSSRKPKILNPSSDLRLS